MNRRIVVKISLSTNPQVEGKYFVDVREITNGSNGQMTTRTTDDPVEFFQRVKREGVANNIEVSAEWPD